ncbi:LLM class flavin-dependent oxidoreductase [Alkalihalobacterium alkalinitrilicum]|uniref:LLM class flavin-dependent oxidoreductase n=1 Tax=Alkalihalobacterium alkalinitrilicum TaxID=427920 RepID=UPI0009953F64|nr:LLM class flavin-dependent oxidoreductase [Alkalihalobacterium alkalinitrilicum]
MSLKFVGFHLMPYQDLPDDFEKVYPSMHVTVPKKLYDPEKGYTMYHDYLDELEYMVEVGLDGVGVNEHHNCAYGMMPSPNLMASVLARKVRDTNTALVVLGNSIALYNPAVRVAEEGAMLDVLSGGRLVQGFPVGTSADTNYVYGVIPAELRERYQEAHDLIIKSWKEEEMFSWNGKYNQLRYVNPWPKPMQKPHPPIWIPGGGSVETYDLTIENNYQFSYLSLYGGNHAKKVMNSFWNRVEELGADMNPYRVGYTQIIFVSETDESAKRDYEQHVRYFYEKLQHSDPRTADAPGYRTIKSLRAGLNSQLAAQAQGVKSAAQLAQSGELTWEDLIEQGYIVAGSPQTVRDRLREIAKDLRVGTIFALLHLGAMPRWLTMKNIQMFGEEVLPHLQDVWSDWDASEYWPKGVISNSQQEISERK